MMSYYEPKKQVLSLDFYFPLIVFCWTPTTLQAEWWWEREVVGVGRSVFLIRSEYTGLQKNKKKEWQILLSRLLYLIFGHDISNNKAKIWTRIARSWDRWHTNRPPSLSVMELLNSGFLNHFHVNWYNLFFLFLC